MSTLGTGVVARKSILALGTYLARGKKYLDISKKPLRGIFGILSQGDDLTMKARQQDWKPEIDI